MCEEGGSIIGFCTLTHRAPLWLAIRNRSHFSRCEHLLVISKGKRVIISIDCIDYFTFSLSHLHSWKSSNSLVYRDCRPLNQIAVIFIFNAPIERETRKKVKKKKNCEYVEIFLRYNLGVFHMETRIKLSSLSLTHS